jgi:bifunctional non-homologous end joining protein LigD
VGGGPAKHGEVTPVLDGLSFDLRAKVVRRRQPSWVTPMLATLTDRHFSSRDWVYERKLDGVRCLVFRRGRSVQLLSRNRLSMNARYPEVVDALERLPARDFVADGEVVAFAGRETSFALLQGRIGRRSPISARSSGITVTLHLFDLLHVDGYDLTQLPLLARKDVLRRSVAFDETVRRVAHRREHGERYLADACRHGWEGLIAKRAAATYQHGRSRDWLKFKCGRRQELVIGGFTEPRATRTGFGALLVGYWEDGRLRYAGKVGTGYDDETLRTLRRELDRLERPSRPFSERTGLPVKGVHWVAPELVAEVGFTEWTADGRLRHPRFLGLRTDKDPKTVTRERPA